MLVAKDRFTANSIAKTVKKEYIAVCEGEINGSGTVDMPIKVMEGRSIQRVVAVDGAPSVTHYFPLVYKNNHTLTRFILETGRTHQIRCHMSSIGHPLAGDDMYGGSLKLLSRQALHCHKMSFIHPITNQQTEIISSLPCDMCSILGLDHLEI